MENIISQKYIQIDETNGKITSLSNNRAYFNFNINNLQESDTIRLYTYLKLKSLFSLETDLIDSNNIFFNKINLDNDLLFIEYKNSDIVPVSTDSFIINNNKNMVYTKFTSNESNNCILTDNTNNDELYLAFDMNNDTNTTVCYGNNSNEIIVEFDELKYVEYMGFSCLPNFEINGDITIEASNDGTNYKSIYNALTGFYDITKSENIFLVDIPGEYLKIKIGFLEQPNQVKLKTVFIQDEFAKSVINNANTQINFNNVQNIFLFPKINLQDFNINSIIKNNPEKIEVFKNKNNIFNIAFNFIPFHYLSDIICKIFFNSKLTIFNLNLETYTYKGL